MAQVRSAARLTVSTIPERAVRPVEVSWERSAILLSVAETIELATALADAVVELRDQGTDA